MSQRTRVSLGLIARNEERNLSDCLSPLVELFDEIIVVDTGSTDRTAEIALSLGAKVIPFAWCDDFSAARNEILRHATGDWLMWVDADDRLDAANLERLRRLISQLDHRRRAFVMRVVSPAEHSSASAAIVTHVRLFPLTPGLCWTGRVHEQILPSLTDAGCQLEYTDISVQHLGYRDPTLQHRKANRDLRLLRMEYAADPTNPLVLFQMGMGHMRLNQTGPALTYLLMSLKYAPTGTASWIRRVYSITAEILRQQQRYEESLSISAQGLARFAFDPELVMVRAYVLVDNDQETAAERLLREFLAAPQDDFLFHGAADAWDRRSARRLLGHICRLQRRFREAERLFQELLSVHPEDIPSWTYLGYVYLSENRPQDLEFVAQQLEKCDRGDIYADTLRAEYCLCQQDWAKARQLLEQAILKAPQLVWTKAVLSELFFQVDEDVEKHRNLLRDILRIDPGNVGATQSLQRLNNPSKAPSDGFGWSFTVGDLAGQPMTGTKVDSGIQAENISARQ